MCNLLHSQVLERNLLLLGHISLSFRLNPVSSSHFGQIPWCLWSSVFSSENEDSHSFWDCLGNSVYSCLTWFVNRWVLTHNRCSIKLDAIQSIVVLMLVCGFMEKWIKNPPCMQSSFPFFYGIVFNTWFGNRIFTSFTVNCYHQQRAATVLLLALTKSPRIKLERSALLTRQFGVFRHIFFFFFPSAHLQILISDLNHSNDFRNTMEAEQN